MTTTVAISTKRILPVADVPVARRGRRAARPAVAERTPAPSRDAALSIRPATPADRPWIESWASQLQLPVPTARRVRTFLLIQDGQRIGHLSAREDLMLVQRHREPVMWIISAFLVPSARGKGLMLKFGEMLSREVYGEGKVAARVAADNTRVRKMMSVGGWTVIRLTRRYVNYVLDLRAPFRGSQ